MKTLFTIIGWSIAILLSGCTTMESSPLQDEETETVPVWTNDLSDEQIAESMPINVETVTIVDETQVDSDGNAVVETANLISWEVPENTVLPTEWTIYQQTDNGVWVPIEIEPDAIQWETVIENGVAVDVYSVTIPTTPTPILTDTDTTTHADTGVDTNADTGIDIDTDTDADVDTDTGAADADTGTGADTTTDSILTTYKVTVTDEGGNEHGNEVTVVSPPAGHPVRVTLSEELDAEAPSGVVAVYNGTSETLWETQRLNNLPLPQSKLLQNTLESESDLLLIVSTDLTSYDFEETMLSRTSNSSFCKVEEVESPADNIVTRLKFSFEDLPLSRIIYEQGVAFDYNDVVLYVDIMVPGVAPNL